MITQIDWCSIYTCYMIIKKKRIGIWSWIKHFNSGNHQIIENGFKEIGSYAFTWNALNHSSGIYYIQIQGDSKVETQKVVLLK